jgi:hypothetical protein
MSQLNAHIIFGRFNRYAGTNKCRKFLAPARMLRRPVTLRLTFGMLILFHASAACGQTTGPVKTMITVHGVITDSAGKPVPYASVNLKPQSSGPIIAYSVADSKGAYSIQFPGSIAKNDLIVEVRSIGFKNQAKP